MPHALLGVSRLLASVMFRNSTTLFEAKWDKMNKLVTTITHVHHFTSLFINFQTRKLGANFMQCGLTLGLPNFNGSEKIEDELECTQM